MKAAELIEAAEQGCLEAVISVLSRGVDVNSTKPNGETALHVACENGHFEIAQHLINVGINVNLKSKFGQTALQACLWYPQKYKIFGPIAELLINAGSDVNSIRANDQMTVLHVAADLGEVELMEFLLARGADLDARHRDGLTPLHTAAVAFYKETGPIETLLAANADISAVDNNGDTPLHCLMRFHLYNCLRKTRTAPSKHILKIMSIFSEYKADFNAKNLKGMTPLDYAMKYDMIESNSYVDMIEAFLTIGKVDVNSKYNTETPQNRLGQSLLHQACLLQNKRLLKMLVRHGADINAPDDVGWSPLQSAVYCAAYDFEPHKVDFLKYLLKLKPNVNTVSKDGSNILSIEKYLRAYPTLVPITVLRHLSRQQAIGVELHPGLLETIAENESWSMYFELCVKELKSLKETIVSPTSEVTFFNLLMDDKKQLKTYIKNEIFVRDFNKTGAMYLKFPLFDATIERRFQKAVQNQIVLKRAAGILSSCLPFNLGSDHLVVEKILSFCKKKDLRVLCKNKFHVIHL